MTPQLITRSKINDVRWNALIQESQQSVLYAFSNYLDLVCEDWNALVCSSNECYEIVMPIPVRRKFGKRVAYQPIFCQYLGIFSRSDLTADQAIAFLQAFSRHFSYISAYHFNPENFSLLSTLGLHVEHLKMSTFHTHWLDLRSSPEKIHEGFSDDRKKNLQDAREMGWVMMKSSNIHPLIYLFVQNHARRIDGGVNPIVYDRLSTLFERLAAIGQAEIWYAHAEGVIRAGIMLVRSGSRVIYLFNAADDIGRRRNARTFLLTSYFAMYEKKS